MWTSRRRRVSGRLLSACKKRMGSVFDSLSVSPAKSVGVQTPNAKAQLFPEKSLSAIDADHVADSFLVNTIGHLLMYKHFVPLFPTQREFKDLRKDGESDPAQGVVSPGNGLLMSLSARVGSIADNEKGGWYSYRSSKAAVNQLIRTVDHELANRKSSAVAIGYHPGTVLTSFTTPVLGDKAKPDRSQGVLSVDDAVESMVGVMGNATREDGMGGRCWDWRGERVGW